MYTSFFGIKQKPFSIAPDPNFLFMSAGHREALAHLRYGLEDEGGFVLLTGEVGTGKTTVCRCLLEQIPDKTNIAFLFNPKLTSEELLATICDELRIDYPVDSSIKVLIDALNVFLLDAHAKGERTVLIIDEAQNLSIDVLEQIRLLTNLETNQQKLMQVILLSQPELNEKLTQQELRQLSQRISARHHLGPLNQEETKAYVLHRLSVAGMDVETFSSASIKHLFQVSSGIPRLINIICDRCLLGAYSKDTKKVTKSIMANAAEQVMGKSIHSNSMSIIPQQKVIGVTSVLCLIILVMIYFANSNEPGIIIKSAENEIGTKITQDESKKIDSLSTGKKSKAAAGSDAKRPGRKNAILSNAQKRARTKSGKKLLNEGRAPNKRAPQDTSPKVVKTFITPSATTGEKLGLQKENAIEWPKGSQAEKSESLAYDTLMQVWGFTDFSADKEWVCQYAEDNGMRCLAQQGGMDNVLSLNRPVMLKMINHDQEDFYMVLTGVQNDSLIFRAGDNEIRANLADVALRWSGLFVLLWQPPPGYEDSIRPGHKGLVVDWLEKQLAQLSGKKISSKNDSKEKVYDAIMVEQVKKVQFANNLAPDGIVGQETIILLNTLSNKKVPVLQAMRN